MSRWYWPALWAATLVACGLLGSQPRGSRQSSPAMPVPAVECPREEVVAELTRELDECRAKAKAAAPPGTRVLRRTRVAHAEGPPRRCGGDGPKIVHVPTRECVKGMVCLDAKAQRALTLNLAAYEGWVRKVAGLRERAMTGQDCTRPVATWHVPGLRPASRKASLSRGASFDPATRDHVEDATHAKRMPRELLSRERVTHRLISGSDPGPWRTGDYAESLFTSDARPSAT